MRHILELSQMLVSDKTSPHVTHTNWAGFMSADFNSTVELPTQAAKHAFGRGVFRIFTPLIPALIALVIPAIVAWNPENLNEAIRDTDSTISTVGNMIAVVISFYAIQRLGRFPGTRRTAYIVPAVSVVFGAIAILILFGRVEFSRYQLIGTYVFTCLWFFINIYVDERRHPMRFAVLPFGRAEMTLGYSQIMTAPLRSPTMPDNANGIIADLRAELADEWLEFLTEAALAGIPVFNAKQVNESLTGTVEIDTLSETPIGSLQPSPIYSRLRPTLDFLGSLAVLPLLLPIMLFVAILIKLDSPGPALFTQQRMGYRGRPFKIYKFRTMSHNDNGPAHTTDSDPRITKLGGMLRRYRIDELPQIINILKGEMSWIGPRPEATALNEKYEAEIPFFRYRYIVKPGITGWAQVQQGHVFDVDDLRLKLHHDLYFIKYFSPWLDLLVVIRTLQTVATGFGAR